MNDQTFPGPRDPTLTRRDFLSSLGKWSSASIMAAVGGAAWISTLPTTRAGAWANVFGGGGSGWVNGGGGGGGWVNTRGGGGWVNGGGAWVNGGAWANRGGSWANGGGSWSNSGGSWSNGSGGSWVNRRGGGGWVNVR